MMTLIKHTSSQAGCVSSENRFRTETLSACPVCENTSAQPWTLARDRWHGLTERSFPYAHCRSCGVVYLETRPVQEDLGFFYPEHYGPYQANVREIPPPEPYWPFPRWLGAMLLPAFRLFNRLFDQFFRNHFSRRLKQAYRKPDGDSAILDFGCGSPAFLNQCRQTGWSTTIGIDFNPAVVDALTDEGHQGFVNTPEVWSRIPDRSLDFVRLNHVFEHLYEPKEFLRRIHPKLKPGGVMHLAVPNPAGWTAMLFRERWFGLECPRHAILYPPETLKKLTTAEGAFEPEMEIHQASSPDICRSLGYWLADAKLLKCSGSPDAMKSHPMLSVLVHIPGRLGALFGRGERYHLFLRKR